MKVILITGGSSGIGASTALECAARGMGVILTYHRNPEGAEQVVSQITAAGGNAIAIPLDVSATDSFPAFKTRLEALLLKWKRADFEFGPRNIRANAISPGAIRTQLGGGLNEAFEALLASQTALDRVGEPEDVALAIAGLISDDNRWVNAQSIEVAGGYQT